MDNKSDFHRNLKLLIQLTSKYFPRKIDDDPTRSILLSFHFKAVKTVAGVKILLDNGMEEDALALCRSLYELTINLIYLNIKDDPFLYNIFIQYPFIKAYQREKPNSNLSLELVKHKEHILENRNIYFSQIHRKVSYENWSGLNIYELSKETKLESLYSSIFYDLSHYTHLNSAGLRTFLNMQKMSFNYKDHYTETSEVVKERFYNFSLSRKIISNFYFVIVAIINHKYSYIPIKELRAIKNKMATDETFFIEISTLLKQYI